MSTLLHHLDLAPENGKAPLPGLVSVRDSSLPPADLAEAVALQEVRILLRDEKTGDFGPIDYIFFRRFADGRSAQVAAYVVDNSDGAHGLEELGELHRKVWLNGTAPLLYVEWESRVDILRCAAGPEFWNARTNESKYNPAESIEVASAVSRELDAKKRHNFSAFRLSTGTFWEDPINADWANADKSAHHRLIQAAIDADQELQANAKKDADTARLMRRLLLLFIFSKYLEDREVFPTNWFAQYAGGAGSFKDVLAAGNPARVQDMLAALRLKFNGDIFDLPDMGPVLTTKTLSRFVELLDAKMIKNQLYLWKQYSFRYIPVEVLSHLYQHFAQEGTGAIYTPPFVADLILDQVMPYEKLTGRETVLDPTCGSGVFLVGALRRLVHHWQNQNDWDRPGVPKLKEILRRSIYGVEKLPEAANVAALNLALAVCDALLPNVIWKNLTFDKLIGRNLFDGDFFENLDPLRAACPKGFDIIVGNPPFKSKLTPAAVSTRRAELRKIPIPVKQIAYRVTEECMDLLAEDGALCLLQPSGILYNAKTVKFRSALLASHTLQTVLDFSAIRNLFEAADTKALALLMKRGIPSEAHEIRHLTFRKSKSVADGIGFELDHYDIHSVTQHEAVSAPWIWKANLLGGGRLVHLTSKIMQWPTLKDFLEEKGWSHGEGFTVGNEKHKTEWLHGLTYIPIEALGNNELNMSLLSKVSETYFEAPRKLERYSPPMFLIGENSNLPCALILTGSYAFRHSIMSINAPKQDASDLKNFSLQFTKYSSAMVKYASLRSTRSLIGRSSSILKKDIEELPWPGETGFEKLSWWEEILLEDIGKHYAPLIRVGPNSASLNKTVSDKAFSQYSKTFVRLLSTVYTNLRAGKNGTEDGIAYQAFHFGDGEGLTWEKEWASRLKDVLIHDVNVAFRTHRIVRFYEGNTLVILKPDRLRNWIPSTAIRDADETLMDLQEQGF